MAPSRSHTDPGIGSSAPPAKVVGTLVIGDAIGPYVVRRYVGAGRDYRAFEGEDRRNGRGVIVRACDGRGGPEAERRLLREGDVLRRLESAYFPRVLEAGRLPDGAPYYVLPLHYGELLSERLVRGPLGIAATLDLGTALMHALGTLHAMGFVHAALGADGVLLRQTLGGTAVMLLDLGQCRPSADRASDLHAAALLLYEALVGQAPPAQGALFDAGRPRRLRADCPPELERVLLRMLSVTPAARPQTAAEVESDLEAIAKQYGFPMRELAWQPASTISSAPPAPLAWDSNPEAALPLTRPRAVGETPSERAFFEQGAVYPEPADFAAIDEPARPRRNFGRVWLPVVLTATAFSAGLLTYALVIADGGARLEERWGSVRGLFQPPALVTPPIAYDRPLAPRSWSTDGTLPLVRLAQADATPEQAREAEPVIAPVPPVRARAVRAKRSAEPRAPRRAFAPPPAPSLPPILATPAPLYPKPEPPPIQRAVPEDWDALPEEHRRTQASDNPYASPRYDPPQENRNGPDRGF
jgi:hypothetical protein